MSVPIILNTFADFLETNAAEFFTTNSDNATYILWGVIRDFANIGLAITILVIIISQLTGYGIDNYGIKKMLPKLIVSALLINLSFIICQLAVDVSNILGASIRGLCTYVSDTIRAARGLGAGAVDLTLGGLFTGVFAALGAGAAAAPIVIGAVTIALGGAAPGLVIAFIIFSLLPILFAVLLFFVLLAGRKVLIIVCAAISPLAFLCLIFPNTQGLFKKWLKLSEGLLVIYPICAGVNGLGEIIRVTVDRSDGTHILMAMIGILLRYAPFFLAPILVKRSLGAIGALAGRIQSMGRNKIGEGMGALKNTNSYKNAAEAGTKRINTNFAKKRTAKFERKRSMTAERLAKKDGKNFGALSSDEQKDYLGKANKELGEGKLAAYAKDQERVREYEAEKDKNERMAESGWLAAATAQDKVSNENADKDLRQWGSGVFSEKGSTYEEDYWRDKDTGDEFYRRPDGSYWAQTRAGRQVDMSKKDMDEKFRSGALEEKNRRYTYNDATGNYESSDGKSYTKSMAEARAQSGRGHIVSDGKFVKNKNGEWVSADGKSNAVLSQADVDSKLAAGAGSMTSFADAKLTEAEISRAASLGSVAGYAGMSEGEVLNVAHSGLKSAEVSTELKNAKVAVDGSNSVLQVQRNDAASANNVTLGKAEATVQLNNQGVSTVTSVEAAAQSAEKQFINVATQNVSAGKTQLSPEQIQQAVNTGSQKLENQFVLETAHNKVGEAPITPDYAVSLETERRSTTQQRMYGEEFKNQPRGEVVARLTETLKGTGSFAQDPDYALAAFDDTIAKGGYEDAMVAIKANEGTANPEVMSKIYKKMATMPEPSMKQYGKYRVEMENNGADASQIGTYQQWLEGTAPTSIGGHKVPAEKASFAGYIKANGNNALVGATKDAFGFYKDNGIIGHISEAQIINGVVSAQDNDARLAGEKLLKKKFENAVDVDTERNNALASLSNSQLAKMQPSTLAVLLGFGDAGELESKPIPEALSGRMSQLKSVINDPNNSSVFAGLSQAVRDFINKAPDAGNDSKTGTRESHFADKDGNPLRY